MATRKKLPRRSSKASSKRPIAKTKPRTSAAKASRTAGSRKTSKLGRPARQSSGRIASDAQIKVPIYAMQTYEHAIIYDIFSSNSEKASSQESLDVLSILSGVSAEANSSSFAAGVRTGRILHEFSRHSPHYGQESNRVADIQRFFSNAGYRNVAYSLFPDRFMLRFTYDANILGIKGHAFEAGVIEGFLNAMGYQGLHVNEEKCMMNGDPYCSFSSTSSIPRQEFNRMPHSKAAMSVLSDRISAKVLTGAAQRHFSEAYVALKGKQSLSYAAEHGDMAMALEMGHTIYSRAIAGKDEPAAKAAMERTISLLNIGRINVKSLKPLKLELAVSLLKSRKEFNDFAEAFVTGLAGYYRSAGHSAEAESDGGRYILKLNSQSKG